MTTILVIDDKPDNLTAVSAMLKYLISGVVVITAQSGPDGIQQARRDAPDTILLDIRMPGMDGYEVCRRLKTGPQTKHIPIIMITAVDTDTGNRVKGLESGADAFLTKPIDAAELAAQVRVMLRIKQAEDKLRREKIELAELVRERTRKLEKAERHYRTLFNNIKDAIFIHNAAGRLLEVNAEACELLGYDRRELLAQNVEHLESPQYSHQIPARIAEVERQGFGVFETTHLTRDGKSIPTELNCSLIDYNDEPAILSVGRNITERRMLEAQLAQAQKMEAIGTLAGGIAHDFNNILGIILGFTELTLQSSAPGSKDRSHLEQVVKACKRAKDLVYQILSFSRKTTSTKKPLQVSHLIDETVTLLRASLPTTINIQPNIKVSSSMVLADPTQIHQVLMNLCANAAHAMKEKGGVLEINLSETSIHVDSLAKYQVIAPGAYVMLTVRDTGHGMDPAIMERIFDPFFTTKAVGEGTGMGLAVVHGIVKSHGGEITVASRVGAGTTFTILLPKIAQEETGVEDVFIPLPTGHSRILFVDDEEMLADLGKVMLENLGHEVVVRNNSLEALRIFQEQPDQFDLVITDQTMPHLTGLQLSQELKNIRFDIPIILCTGFSETLSGEKIKAVGIDEFLMKPIDIRKLAETISQVIK